jgi:hypothetical protein
MFLASNACCVSPEHVKTRNPFELSAVVLSETDEEKVQTGETEPCSRLACGDRTELSRENEASTWFRQCVSNEHVQVSVVGLASFKVRKQMS